MKYQLIAQPNPNYTPLVQILNNRGIDIKDINNYLTTTDDVIIDPRKLDNITQAVKLLVKHIKKPDCKILIQVDSDVDGYTSAALLGNYLNKLFPSKMSQIFFKIHEGKEHGIILSDELINENFTLIIIPDAGSNQFEEHKALKDAGIDVLVLDHHETEKCSEDAIVVNNQLSENYENKSLSGVGVVYKFCKLIDEIRDENIADGYLDLVALGMISDMMDLRSFETKHLINKGIANINNPFFKGLIDRQAYSLGPTITPIGIAFYIAPMINATIRVGTQEEKMIMFQAMLENSAYRLIPSTKRGHKGEEETIMEQAIRNCVNIKSRQKKMRDQGVEQIEAIIQRDNLNDNQILLVETTGILNQNLTGLVANQLMAKYQKPVLLLRSTEDNLLEGSGRGYDKSEFNNFKDFLHESGLVDYAEGHQSAFGVGINADNVESFIAYSNEMLADYDFNASYNVDYIFDADNLKPQDIMDIAKMKALWGKGIDEAYIVVRNIKVTEQNLRLLSADRNPTLKISLFGGALTLIKFGSSEKEYKDILSKGYTLIDICGKCSANVWNGNITPQILIEDFEIKQKVDYYF